MTQHGHTNPTPGYAPEFKRNWEPFFKRMKAWWDGTLEGPIIRIPAQRTPWRPDVPPDDTDWKEYHCNTAAALTRYETLFRHARYFTDLAPCMDTGVGHGIASFLGCPMEFRRETVWTHPCMTAIDDPIDVTSWRGDSRWQAYREKMIACSARAARRYGLVYYLGGVIQAMALMRGDAAFLMDLLDYPAAVESLRDRLLPEWFAMAEEMESMLPQDGGQWTLFWLWAPGRVVFCECDVSCNISPKLFRRYVVPEVRAMAQWADYSLYHLDGPRAVMHLDALLEIPELDCVQWIRGDGGGTALDWIPLLRRIQAGGKLVYVECSLKELAALLAALQPRGLLVHLDPCTTPEQVQESLRIAAKHGAVEEAYRAS